jgi:hypothetical protein
LIQAICYDTGVEPATPQRRDAMELLDHTSGLLLGLMGWAATLLALEGAAGLTVNDRRAMTVCSWMVWMLAGFGTLVMRGVLSIDTAALTVTFSTIALGIIVLLGARARPPRTRP